MYLYVFVCGRRRTIKCSSNQNVESERYDWLSCLSVKYEFAYLCTPCLPDMICHQRAPAIMKGAIIVILCSLNCNVFTRVNERWGNLTELHSILYTNTVSHLVSGLPVRIHVFWRRRGFAKWLCREGGELAFKANIAIDSLSEITYPTVKTRCHKWLVI